MIVCLLLLTVLKVLVTGAVIPKVSCLDSLKVLALFPHEVFDFGAVCFIGFRVLSWHVVLLDFL